MPQAKPRIPVTEPCAEHLALALSTIVDWYDEDAGWNEVVESVQQYGNARAAAIASTNFPAFERELCALEPPS